MKNNNDIKLFGRLYDFDVKFAARKDGTPVQNDDGDTALTGRVTLEINENGNTVVAEYFAYPKWPSGKVNSTYGMLRGMLDGDYVSVVSSTAPATNADGEPNPHAGKEPEWMSLAGSIDVNYFVSKKTKELSRSLKVRGSFINENKKKEYSAIWTADTIVTNIEHIDADDEKELPAYIRLDGYIADYKENIYEVSFNARSEDAISKLPVSEASKDNPMYTMIRGSIVFANRVVKSTDAFGDEVENEYENKNWDISKYALEAYDFFDEDILGAALFDVKLKELAERKEEVLAAATGGGSDEKKPELDF